MSVSTPAPSTRATATDPAATAPVVAEVVAAAPSPWRFGLKALMALMVVCSVQFALMNYLGVLGGLGVGLVACTAAFTVILLGGMVLTGRQTRHLQTMDVLIVRIMLATLVLVLGTILAGGGTAMYHALARLRTERILEDSLGMKLSRVQVNDNNNVKWGLRIASVKTGGIAHQSGIVQDEVIVVEGTVDEFIDRLYANRGKSVDVNVADQALNKSLQNCTVRSVTLNVPQ